jgi:hypothetical protein
MDGTLVRTSVTIDEAVAILLGWAKGPILFNTIDDNPSIEDQDFVDSLMFCLNEELLEQLETRQGDLASAQIDGQSESIIEERRAAIKEQHEVARLAQTYLCAVEDELNKGEQSELRVDKTRANNIYTYITMTSLDAWMYSRYGKTVLTQNLQVTPGAVKQKPDQPFPRRKMRDQEEAILRVIKELGYRPDALPLRESGKSGVKAATFGKLASSPFFKNKGVFDSAWERLRGEGTIADST